MYANEAEIERLAHHFLALTLPKPQWTHAAHFAAALFLLRQGRGREMPERIRVYNVAVGGQNTDTDGYHETITWASLRAAEAQRLSMPNAPLDKVANALLAGPLGASRWPLEYWSEGVLFSPQARRAWVEPDLKPLPFPPL